MDGKFTGYEPVDKNTADKMIQYLNDPTYGKRIEYIYVTYSTTPCDEFCKAIQCTTVPGANGDRRATAVIRSRAEHKGHFHWYITKE